MQAWYVKDITTGRVQRWCAGCHWWHPASVFGGFYRTCQGRLLLSLRAEAAEVAARVARAQSNDDASGGVDGVEVLVDGDSPGAAPSEEASAVSVSDTGAAGGGGLASATGDAMGASSSALGRATGVARQLARSANALPARPPEWCDQTTVVGGKTAVEHVQDYYGDGAADFVMRVLGRHGANTEDVKLAVDTLAGRLANHGMPSPGATVVCKPAAPAPSTCVLCGKTTVGAAFVGKSICLLCAASGKEGLTLLDTTLLLDGGLLYGKGEVTSGCPVLRRRQPCCLCFVCMMRRRQPCCPCFVCMMRQHGARCTRCNS